MKPLRNVVGWFIPASFPSASLDYRVFNVLISSLLIALLGLGFAYGAYYPDLHEWKWVLFALVLSLILIKSLGNLILPFPQEDTFFNFDEVDKAYLQRIVRFQRLCLLWFFCFIPVIIYALSTGNLWFSAAMVLSECTMLTIIVLLKKEYYQQAIHLSLMVFYLIACFSPLYSTAQGWELMGIAEIFIVIHYVTKSPKTAILNRLMAIISVGLYILFQWYPASQKAPLPIWITMFMGICIFFVIAVVLNYYQKEIYSKERKLNQAFHFLKQISDLNPDAIYTKDQAKKYSFINNSFQKIFGFSQHEIMGNQDHQLIPTPLKTREWEEEDDSILSDGLTILGHIEKIEDRNGQTKWLESTKTPIMSDTGEIVGILGISKDISLKYKTEEALRQSEARYRNLFENNVMGIATLSDGRINQFNHALSQITGFQHADLIGYPLNRVLHPADEDKLTLSLHKILLGEIDQVELECQFERIDGTRGHCLAKIQGLFDKKGQHIESMCTIIDLSQSRKQEEIIERQSGDLHKKRKELEKVMESNWELENYALMASHDLKAPIRTIASFTRLLEKSASDRLDERELEFLHFIIKATGNMHRLVQDLLSYSRIDAQKPEPENLDLNILIKDLINELAVSIIESNARINIGPLPQNIWVDRTQMWQLFQNLISNAVKFRQPDTVPDIEISVEEQAPNFIFCVKDRGIGIAKEHQKRIFELFQKAHAQPGELQGSGIGLATCKKIVEAHGGKIWIESNPGEGSSFYFSLPLILRTSGAIMHLS